MDVRSVYRVMKECRNFFETGCRETEYTISGGVLSPANLFPEGSYIAIDGSFFHKGVFRIGKDGVLEGEAAGASDETFRAKIWFLSPPAGFLSLCEDVAVFCEKTPKGAYQSESFGDYSYSRAGGKNGGVLTWQQQFCDGLAQYRNMFTEVGV